jgi:hypothetical protein
MGTQPKKMNDSTIVTIKQQISTKSSKIAYLTFCSAASSLSEGPGDKARRPSGPPRNQNSFANVAKRIVNRNGVKPKNRR